jgi:D-tyrosyl-tRNA(Tyr) deacylase
MKALLQRVRNARVEVDGRVTGAIGEGLLILLGVGRRDTAEEASYLAAKVAHLRVFADEAGRINRSVVETGGSVLLISQFTLYGGTRKGRRPSFDEAAPPELARELYEYFGGQLRALGLTVETGVFQAHMEVTFTNTGPVTLLCESPIEFS